MTLYCQVTDGKIVDGPRRLPRVWFDRLDFHLTDAATLQALGWLPTNAVEGLPAESPTIHPARVEFAIPLAARRSRRKQEMRRRFDQDRTAAPAALRQKLQQRETAIDTAASPEDVAAVSWE